MRNFSQVKRIVIKIGTATLSKNGKIDKEYVGSIVHQIAKLKNEGRQIVIVSSGAIGMGSSSLNLKGPVVSLKMRQACAAIGMPLLMYEYKKAFSKYGILVAQVLLTVEVLNTRRTYLNLRTTMETLLKLGVVPIVNENDCISTEEIGTAFGDNDRLSALVASKLDSDLLIILSDVDALYDKNPRKYDDAKPIKVVTEITKDIERIADKHGSMYSTGGMKTKIEAAKIASDAGCKIVLANGREPKVIERILVGENIGTLFLPKRKLNSRQRWILHSRSEGTIYIDEGAMNAIQQKKSLLPSGVIKVEGDFVTGAVVDINDKARIITNLSSEEIKRIAGKHSSSIRELLGENRKDEIVSHEDIVFFED
jgi:glutamate 5-kinase